jgi:hypothetical protein
MEMSKPVAAISSLEKSARNQALLLADRVHKMMARADASGFVASARRVDFDEEEADEKKLLGWKEGRATFRAVHQAGLLEEPLFNGARALELACEFMDVSAVEGLLDLGAKALAMRGKDGASMALVALKAAPHWRSGRGRADESLIKKIQALAAAGADFSIADESGNAPAHVACSSGLGAVVLQALLSRGVDLAARNQVGYTPLHLAAQCGLIELVELLVGAGANPCSILRVQGPQGWIEMTPSQIAKSWEGIHRRTGVAPFLEAAQEKWALDGEAKGASVGQSAKPRL